MPLNAEKMSETIFEQLNNSWSLDGLDENDVKSIKENWRKLANAISKGVVNHIKNESEVKDVEITIDENIYIQTNMVRVE
ncbi:MAG: hypothetical protein JRD93_08675 [Deltaproteobacteria bacterium]|nr:hypothetical protein [Deltaproteobacteria bacterium]